MKTNKTEGEMKTYAKQCSERITMRKKTMYGVCDVECVTSEKESEILYSCIYGALLAIYNGAPVQAAADTAEFIGDVMIPEMNGFDSIYLKIKNFNW